MLVPGPRQPDDHGDICKRGAVFCNVATRQALRLDVFAAGARGRAVKKAWLTML